MLVWPFSFFNYLAVEMVRPFEHSLPWFAFALHGSLVAVSSLTTLCVPFFLFLTLVNNNDPLLTRVMLSIVHMLWWSLVITIVGSVLCVLFAGVPALVLDLVLKLF